MQPQIAVDITARDKTERGRKSAERGFGQFSRKTSGLVNDSGLTKLGKVFDGLSKFRTLSFTDMGKSLSLIGRTSAEVSGGLAGAAEKAVLFGTAGRGAMAGVAEGAAAAAGTIGGLVTILGAVGAATYMLGDKWAKTGAEIGRTSQSLGVSAQELQTARAAAERFGVSADQTTSSIDALGSTLYDAKYGANNLALGALGQLGVKLKQTKDGAIDVNAAMMDIADAIARQKDPMVQKKLASIFGLSAMLPALRQGSAALRREGADYVKSGAALTDAEVARSTEVAKKSVTLKQHLSAAEKTLGVNATPFTGAANDVGLQGASAAKDAIVAGPKPGTAMSLLAPGLAPLSTALNGANAIYNAARRWGAGGGGSKPGASAAPAASGAGSFEDFANRIEQQESRGHQFDRYGRPLTSPKGAIGAMQVIPETGERAARRAGIAWDPERFKTDKAYNRVIGRAELKRLLDKYGGDQVLAAAAYNAGEGRLDGWTDRAGRHKGWIERFGDPRKGGISDKEFASKIPFPETNGYVGNTANLGKAQVEITLKGAPPGTVARVSGAPGIDVNMHVARSMEGQP
jgi:soluble lytic murein transglycosylase-like protein